VEEKERGHGHVVEREWGMDSSEVNVDEIECGHRQQGSERGGKEVRTWTAVK